MQKLFRNLFISIGLVSIFASSSWAYIPEPKSAGSFVAGKGTKAEETYETMQGAPIYTYGKGLQLGPVHVKPSVDYRFGWEDNVFREEDVKKSDYHHNLFTDLSAELPLDGGQHLLTGAWRTFSQWYDRYDSQDHTDHTLYGSLTLNYASFTLGIEDTLYRTEERAETEFTSRVERYENIFRSLLQVPFASFFIESEVLNLTVDYSEVVNEIFTHNDFTYFQRVGVDVGPETQALVEYGYKSIDYDESPFNRDADAHQISGGLRGLLTELIAYQVWLGGQFRQYDLDSLQDFDGVVFRAALTYTPTETSTWTLKGEREPQESTFDGQNFFVRNRIQLGWQQQIMERLFWNSKGSLGYHEYSRISVRAADGIERTRRDIAWNASTGLEYKMPNDIYSFLVEYRIDSRESNLNGLDFDAQAITAGVRAQF